MRSIINISLPEATAKEIRHTAKTDGFASVSEFFRYLVREYKREELARRLNTQKKSGNWKKLRSVEDLNT